MNIEVGAFAPSPSKQLGLSRRAFSGMMAVFDADASAITRLAVKGLLTDVEARKARKRLIRDMEREQRREASIKRGSKVR